MLNYNLPSSRKVLHTHPLRKTVGISLLLASLSLGAVQGAEFSKTPTQLFEERNNTAYTLDDIKAQINPILDTKIEQDFWPFIEVLFDSNFPDPVHSPLAVFKNWNRFFEKLKKAKDAVNTEELHPQIKILRTDIICHHFGILLEKYPALADKAYS